MATGREQVSAERLVAVVRVHADRVHDAVRRLGCAPSASAEVVETSALDLVRAVAAGGVPDPLGWWFARAQELAAGVQTGSAVPVGEGVLATDRDQVLLGDALDALPERERLALLLRDSYDLPAESVGGALGTAPDAAMEQVGRARLAFLPRIDGSPSPSLGGHPADLGALARIAEGGPVAARDATTRRHAQTCGVCRAVVEAQDYAHRLLAGLVVVALPEAERDALLARVEAAAHAALPAQATLAVPVEELEDEDDLYPRRLLTPLGALLGLVLAAALGLGLGLLLVRNPGAIDPAVAAGRLQAPITAAPVPTVAPPSREQVQRARTPPPAETRVFTLPTRTPEPPPPPPSPSPRPTEDPVDQLGIGLDPAEGPNGQQVTVSGTGWTPGVEVRLTYLDPVGTPTGSSATAVPDERGRFTTVLAALDPQNLPGSHEVRAEDGAQTASATYSSRG